MKLKSLLVLFLLVATLGSTTSFAQGKSKAKAKAKAKTTKVHKVRKASTNKGDYYNGHKIYTGPRGGRYYINSNGRKTYI